MPILRSLTLAAALAVPAVGQAGGLTLDLVPRTTEARDAVALGLLLYDLVENDGRATVRQRGRGNLAGIGQRGRGHRALIHQDGDGHDAEIVQRGRANAFGLFQFGDGASARRSQIGIGQAGITLQLGW